MTDERTSPPPARLRDLLTYLAEHRGVLIVVLAISLLGAGLNLAQPIVVNRDIDAVGAGAGFGGMVVVLVGLVIAPGITDAVQQYLLGRTAEGVVLSARRRLLGRLLRLPVKEYDTRRTGDLVSRVGSDTTMVREALTGGLVEAVSGALVFTGALIAMALLDLTLLGITAAVVLVAVVSVTLVSARIQALTLESQEALGRVSSGVERALSGVRTIRPAGATAREEAALVEDAGTAYRLGVRIVRISALLWPVSGLAIQAAFLAVLGVGGYRVAAGSLSVADLVTFILFLFMMLMPLGTAFGAVITVRTASVRSPASRRCSICPPRAMTRSEPRRTGWTGPSSRSQPTWSNSNACRSTTAVASPFSGKRASRFPTDRRRHSSDHPGRASRLPSRSSNASTIRQAGQSPSTGSTSATSPALSSAPESGTSSRMLPCSPGPSATTSSSPLPRRTRNGAGVCSATSTCSNASTSTRRDSMRSSVMTGRASPAGSASGLRSPGRSWPTPRCSCSMSRPRASTHGTSPRCAARSAPPRSGARSSSSPIA